MAHWKRVLAIAAVLSVGCVQAGCGDEVAGGGAGLGGACQADADCAGDLECVSGSCVSDSDGDGALDDVDNCRDIPNADQADADDDGIGDACDDTDGSGDNNDVNNNPQNPDPDGDGIDNDDDNCPDTYNPDQADDDGDGDGNACDADLDADGDGVLDDADNCPETPNPGQIDSDDDGDGDACDDDADGDGIDDDADNCPQDANVDQADGDGDGDGDVCDDDDGDGVTDDTDNCPQVSNPNQTDTDGDGLGDVCDEDSDDDGILDDGDGSGTAGDGVCEDAETADCDDNCVTVVNPDQHDIDGDGQGDSCDADATRRVGRGSDPTCMYAPPAGQFTPNKEWSRTVSASDAYPDRNQVMMTPAVANLNDDNGDGVIDTADIPDVVYTTFQTNQNPDGYDALQYGVLRAVSGDGSGLLWSVGYDELSELSVLDARINSTDGLGIAPAASVALGDIDDDGNVEIVAGLWHDNSAEKTGGLVAIDHDGTPLWATEATNAAGVEIPTQFKLWYGGISIANIDGMGTPEIVAGATVFDGDGNLLFDGDNVGGLSSYPGRGINWRNGDSTGIYGGMLSAVADLDAQRDPDTDLFTMEIVTGKTAYTADGDVFWEADPTLADGYPALADFDGDLNPEVVVSANGTVRIQDGQTGAVVWGPVTIEDANNNAVGRIGPPTIADFDGDGTPSNPDLEIGVAGSNQYVALDVDANTLDADTPPTPGFESAKLWSKPTQDVSSSITGSSLFDFQGDGEAEVVYNGELYLWVFDGATGDVLFQEPNSSYTAVENPIIADVDNDGNAEIVVGSNNFECGDRLACIGQNGTGITVFGDAEDNWVATRRIWNQHTYHITNVGEDGSIPAQETDNWYVSNTYRLNELTEIDAQAAPDLIGEDPEASAEACYVSAKVWVTNTGAVRVGAGLPVTFYGIDSNGQRVQLAQGQTQLPLEPGESERVDASLTLPTGTWDIEAVIDDDGSGSTENECAEDNNTVALSSDQVCSAN